MQTEVEMVRPLLGGEVHQRSKSGFLCATDLERIGVTYRASKGMSPFVMRLWLQQQGVKEFIKALEHQFGQVLISGRGRGHKTWMHPFLFIDMALSISPELKIEVYSWLYDHLIQYRNDSGDSYKRMAGSLYQNIENKTKFQHLIVQTADKIKQAVGVDSWQEASEKQLRLRDKMHDNIALLADVIRMDRAIELGIKNALETNPK